MSSGDKPKKPFLEAGDLSSELDAWDQMFDGLHSEATAAEVVPSGEVMAWPAATTEPSVRAERPAESDFVDEEATRQHDEAAIDAQLTLDRAVAAASPFADSWEPPEGETDFSDVGAEGSPAALGDLLGTSNRMATRVPERQPEPEEDVYTSASRPNLSAPVGRALTEDPIAPPPPPAAAPVRRTAAIIRRTPEGGAPSLRPTSPPPMGEHDHALLESTRVQPGGADDRRGSDRSKAPTAPPPMSFQVQAFDEPAEPPEDDYEIEIGADAAESANAPKVEQQPARRKVAHVVRRPDTPRTTTPLPPPPRASSPVIEIAPARTNAEDDFSDVAAAVGATEDVSELPPDRDDLAIPAELDPAVPLGSSSDSFLDLQLPSFDGSLPPAVTIQETPRLPTFTESESVSPGFEEALTDANAARTRGTPTTPPPRAFSDDVGDLDRVNSTVVLADVQPISDRPPAIVDLYPRVKTPTSVPPLGDYAEPAAPAALRAPAAPSALADDSAEIEPTLDLEAMQWPEQIDPLPASALDEDAAATLAIYERELATLDQPAQVAALRVEAGRLCERLGEGERAHAHYDAALLANPRAMPALRGLRRIARSASDLAEATRHLDAELAVAGALERRPLGHYRVDLLLASGEQDLARVAVGELLDTAPSDVRALLAQLELAFLDGRADEFGRALEQLAHAVADGELRASVQVARGVLSAHQNDGHAARWFAAAAESNPSSLAARLGMLRFHVHAGDAAGAAQAMLDLAQQLGATDPAMAAALAIRAQDRALGEPAAADPEQRAIRVALASTAARVATDALPADPLVARLAAETELAAGDTAAAAAALAAWASCAAPRAERSYAAARAAELDPAHGAELWAMAVQHDPGDDYGAAQLRTAHVAAEHTQLAIEVDLAVAADVERDRARLRAAFGMIAQNQLEAAIELLRRAHAERPSSLALAEALAEALSAAGRWGERAQLLGELAASPGEQLDADVAQLRSALAWEEAVGAAAEADNHDELQRACAAALGAWTKVLERDPTSPTGHAAAIALATRLGDRDVLGEALSRAQEAARSPWATAGLALRRARMLADDPARAVAAIREAAPALDDPRRTAMLLVAAARRNEIDDASAVLEERAAMLGATPEAATLRLRAAQLALDAGDAVRASQLLVEVERALPALGIVRDLLSAARRRAGDRDRSGPIQRVPEGVDHQAASDTFAQLIRDADAAATHDGGAALALYQRALEIHPGDPVAAIPMIRVATQIREPGPIAGLALAELRAAEAASDGPGKASAYELLAHIDRELRGDPGSAQIALESASQADPSRVDLMHRLAMQYTIGDQISELLRLRRAELDQLPTELARDRAALVMDTASLAERDHRPDLELVELYRAALAADPRHRLALLHLESIVRRSGASAELAKLEEQIADYFGSDFARSQASFYTRAGETLAELGQVDAAVQKFSRADAVVPGHAPALEAWRSSALKGQLWLDAADASTRQANATTEPEQRARLHHFAGVVLMDKALAGEQAMQSFRSALEADPSHKDAFLRLRILLEEDARHDELAILLTNRLEHETDANARAEMHRAAARLFRDFLGDRDRAKHHYREILAHDPNDLRAHAALADIAWEQGAWQDAADALIARARLETNPEILKTLCFRLGLIYADRLVDVPMALKAFQRALSYQPDDEATLVRLADLAAQIGEWKLALGACERLVKAEQDADKRAQHLHRVARIFRAGFGDMKRAERALNLALDGAPTSDEALSELVRFYRESGDMTSVRVHLNRVAGTMRTRLAQDPRQGIAYRVIARTMAARADAGVSGSIAIARAGAELATLLGAGGDVERVLLADPPHVDLSRLLRPESDELLFPRGIQPELRQLFTLLGDRIAKHVGVDLRAYGVGRGDRLRARDSAVAAHAQDVATGLGFGEIDVYVSTRLPFAMIAEPTSPVSLVIGQGVAQADARAVRFAAGAALKIAQCSLAIPARMSADDLGVLVVALVRLFQLEFPGRGLDEGAISGQTQKLRRLVPTGLMNELKPYGFAIDAGHFNHADLARDLRVAGLRAGLVASGSLVAGLQILAAQAGTDVPGFLADPVAQGLLSFALADDHASVAG